MGLGNEYQTIVNYEASYIVGDDKSVYEMENRSLYQYQGPGS